MEYERFCIYGFGIDYPATWKVELNPKSKWEEGDVVFKSPERTNIFVTWGPLEKARKKFPSSDEQAEDSLRRLRKSEYVRKVELIRSESTKINSHKASFTHARLDMSRSGLIPFKGTIVHQESRSLHLHCEQSGRYFVIYGMSAPESSLEQAEIFENMSKSFKCHITKPRSNGSSS